MYQQVRENDAVAVNLWKSNFQYVTSYQCKKKTIALSLSGDFE